VHRNFVSGALNFSNTSDARVELVIFSPLSGFIKIDDLKDPIKSIGYFRYIFNLLPEINRLNRFLKRVLILPAFARMIDWGWRGKAKYLWGLSILIFISPLVLLSIGTVFFRPKNAWRPSKNDTFLILGSEWVNSKNYPDALAMLRNSECRVVTLIHDLIPFSHASFCDDNFAKLFNSRIKEIIFASAGILANSAYTKSCINEYLRVFGGVKKSIHVVPLGYELDLVENDSHVRNNLKIFLGEKTTFISVGTLEPRKNYPFLLDAMDILWASGSPAKLCIIGKYGWKCDGLVSRIINHSEYNKKLIWFGDLSDAELEYAYSRAMALIFPSVIEGFGLPLVEALSRRCPVLASDIPIFHEIGGDYCLYFPLDRVDALAQLLAKIVQSGKVDTKRSIDEFTWPDWGMAANTLLSEVRQIIENENRAPH